MELYSTYKTMITDKSFNHVLSETVEKYREAVSFFSNVALDHWELFKDLGPNTQLRLMEHLTVKTKKNPYPKHDFTQYMYKYPCYYRRAAIMEALGKVSSYMENLKRWERERNGKRPGIPKTGYVYPALYRGNCFDTVEDDPYHMKIKVWIRNTWDFITVPLRKSDVDYILHHCKNRKACVPTLRRRGKNWFLDFSFEERVSLTDEPIDEQTILAVDLGINSACVCCAMRLGGTILGRRFLDLPKEEDSLSHALGRIKKAQQKGNYKTPRLWAAAKGINDRISVLTSQFIVNCAVFYNASTIVFEHLETRGKKRGGRSKRQRIHHWRASYVQQIVSDKAHRLFMHVVHVNAKGTSKLAFDGSGTVIRGRDAGFKTNSLCRFQSGKIYNCDLNASYNIGGRYFIREILKSVPATERLRIEAKVPQCSRRSTCTLSTLISLHAELSNAV